MQISKAVNGFILDSSAGELSERTCGLYEDILGRFVQYFGEIEVSDIKYEDLSKYMQYLRTDYRPHRFGGKIAPISGSTLDNNWKAIRSFFKWCHIRLGVDRPDTNLPRPHFKLPEVEPFSEEEVKKLLNTCDAINIKDGYHEDYRRKRATAIRDKAILLILLDTGVRLGELLRLRFKDVNLDNGEIRIQPFASSIKSRPRTAYLGKSGKRTVWHYLSTLDDDEHNETDTIFSIGPHSVQTLLKNMGKRAGVVNVHPHRFRHTFAIQYLRNGGDIFTLQRILGHSTLEMVRHYVALADTDAKDAHRRASPADRWRL